MYFSNDLLINSIARKNYVLRGARQFLPGMGGDHWQVVRRDIKVLAVIIAGALVIIPVYHIIKYTK